MKTLNMHLIISRMICISMICTRFLIIELPAQTRTTLNFNDSLTYSTNKTMQQELLLHILVQNQITCSVALEKVTIENINFKLNEKTASVGFMYRHIGETMNLFGTFFGIPTQVENTTMGAMDTGQGKNFEESKILIKKGYDMLQKLIEDSQDAAWLELIDTPFFGKIPKVRLFSHILFHNAHHAGQISLTLSKGEKQ